MLWFKQSLLSHSRPEFDDAVISRWGPGWAAPLLQTLQLPVTLTTPLILGCFTSAVLQFLAESAP